MIVRKRNKENRVRTKLNEVQLEVKKSEVESQQVAERNRSTAIYEKQQIIDKNVHEQKKVSEYNEYVNWLNGAYIECLLPGNIWNRMMDEFSSFFVFSLNRQHSLRERRQCLFDLLGDELVKNYFLYDVDTIENRGNYDISSDDVSIINELEMNKKMILVNGGKNWIFNEFSKHIQSASVDLKEMNMRYVKETYEIIEKEFEKYICKQQKKMIDNISKNNDGNNNDNKNGEININILDGTDQWNPNLLNDMSIVTVQEKTKIDGQITYEFSDTVARPMISLLENEDYNSAIFQRIRRSLCGRALPPPLRDILWKKTLFRASGDFRLQVQKVRLAENLEKGKKELKLDSVFKTTIAGTIENAIISTYDKLRMSYQYTRTLFDKKKEMSKLMNISNKILNLYFIIERSFEYFYIYWIIPLLLQERLLQNNLTMVNPLDIVLQMDYILNNYRPLWSDIFEIADRAFLKLQSIDIGLFQHIITSMKNQAEPIKKDFYSKIISPVELKSEMNTDSNKRRLITPEIFIRKWLLEAFVGSTHFNVLMFLWDQFFIEQWSSDVLEQAIHVILLALKSQFLSAKTFLQCRQVFLRGAFELFTYDVQLLWWTLRTSHQNNQSNTFTPRKTYFDINEDFGHVALAQFYFHLIVKDENFNPTLINATIQLCKVNPGVDQRNYVSKLYEIRPLILHSSNRLNEKSYLFSLLTDSRSMDEDNCRASNTMNRPEGFIIDFTNDIMKMDKKQFSGCSAIVTINYKFGKGKSKKCGETIIPLIYQENISNVSTWTISQSIVHRPIITTDRLSSTLFERGSYVSSNIFSPENYGTIYNPLDVAKRENCFTFVLFIDHITNIPEIATVLKVTGTILNGGNDFNANKANNNQTSFISTFPNLENSSVTQQSFGYRQFININGTEMNEKSLLLLRVYTRHRFTKKLIVLGTTLMSIFTTDENGRDIFIRNGNYRLGLFPTFIKNLPSISHMNELNISKFLLNQTPPIPLTQLFLRLYSIDESKKILTDYPKKSNTISDFSKLPPFDGDVYSRRAFTSSFDTRLYDDYTIWMEKNENFIGIEKLPNGGFRRLQESKKPTLKQSLQFFLQTGDHLDRSLSNNVEEWMNSNLDQNMFLKNTGKIECADFFGVRFYDDQIGVNLQTCSLIAMNEKLKENLYFYKFHSIPNNIEGNVKSYSNPINWETSTNSHIKYFNSFEMNEKNLQTPDGTWFLCQPDMMNLRPERNEFNFILIEIIEIIDIKQFTVNPKDQSTYQPFGFAICPFLDNLSIQTGLWTLPVFSFDSIPTDNEYLNLFEQLKLNVTKKSIIHIINELTKTNFLKFLDDMALLKIIVSDPLYTDIMNNNKSINLKEFDYFSIFPRNIQSKIVDSIASSNNIASDSYHTTFLSILLSSPNTSNLITNEQRYKLNEYEFKLKKLI